VTPEKALHRLEEGNARFVAGRETLHDHRRQVAATASVQNPFAIVLACIDSRVAPEIVFDTEIGDIFTACVPGNVLGPDVLAGMEFAVAMAGSRLIVVLGHTGCGAVAGACDDVHLGHLTGLLTKIRPAVDAEVDVPGERTSANRAFVDAVSRRNVVRALTSIPERSPVIRDLIDQGEVRVAGAMYDIASGRVTFLE
jgi:carbonic anhydrase